MLQGNKVECEIGEGRIESLRGLCGEVEAMKLTTTMMGR